MGTPFETRSSYVPYPGSEETTVITCMDDRPGELGLQIGGGVYGLSQDRAAAMEMLEDGKFTGLDLDVHIFAGAVTGALAEEKIDGTMHYGCAAFELADTAIADVICDDAKLEKLFGIAGDIYLPLGMANASNAWAMFIRGVKAQRKIIESGKLATRDQAEYDLFDGGGVWHAPAAPYVPPRRIHLQEPEHAAGDVIINHVPGYAFDSRKAWGEKDRKQPNKEPENPAYCISVGSFREMNEPLNHHFGTVPLGAFTLAAAVRHAAIITVLPKPEGQEVLNVHPIRHL